MEINKSVFTTLKGSVVLTLGIALAACFNSKPDISGAWVPESVDKNATFYAYYMIGEKDSNDRYSITKFNYKIRNPLQDIKPIKLPQLVGKIEGKKLEFVKDNTYCVEGSLQTECVVYTDGKLDFYNQGTFVKSNKTPPEIPVNQ
ncbi:hypothetical protein [Acinetobacter sp. Leaf130]|uniref:hypothetical protein n=1 Tax=Acinetobacter sp. Leaf130 TaxID=1736269 RepID=UPI0006F80EAF|nr:hypothetical protein [Acinetobacter sp. Leaf130]KQQ65476.1 hypothetical protein ASF86_18525 [Acinetobacter sp. Leaf130]